MKLVEKIKKQVGLMDWVLISLLCAGIVLIALGPIIEKNIYFFTLRLMIRAGIAMIVFITVLIGGSLLEKKIATRFQNKLKGGGKK